MIQKVMFQKTVVRLGFWIIAVYQKLISSVIPARCRYYPTCSMYAKDALKWHGLQGFWLIAKRMARCHPWGGLGIDFVPVPMYLYRYVPSGINHSLVGVATMDYSARLAWLLKYS